MAVLDRDPAQLDAVVATVRAAGGDALAIPPDITDFLPVESAAATVAETFGPIDVWASCDVDSRRTTRMALAYMRTRDHGVVVQIKSGTAPDGDGVTGLAPGKHNRVRLTTVSIPDYGAGLTEIAARTVVSAAEHPERTQYRVGPSRLADGFLDGFDRRELRLSAVTWLAMGIQTWAWKLEQRLRP